MDHPPPTKKVLGTNKEPQTFGSDRNETKQLKLNINSSLKGDHLEVKYSNICAIDEDEDDLEAYSAQQNLKKEVITNQRRQSQKAQGRDTIISAQTQNRLSITSSGFNSNERNKISSSRVNPLELNIKKEQIKGQMNNLAFVSKKFSDDKITTSHTLSSQNNILLSNRSKQGIAAGFNLSISRNQTQRYRNHTNSEEESISKPRTSQAEFNSRSPRRVETQRLYSQNQKYKNNRSNLSASSSSFQQKNTRPTLTVGTGITEDQLIRQFPFAQSTSETHTPYLFNSRSPSDGNLLNSTFLNNSRQGTQLASILFSQKQVNDVEQIRKKGKNDFYTQLASFEANSPVDPIRSLKEIQQIKVNNQIQGQTQSISSKVPASLLKSTFDQLPSKMKNNYSVTSYSNQSQFNPLDVKIIDSIEVIEGIAQKQGQIAPSLFSPSSSQNAIPYSQKIQKVLDFIEQEKKSNQGLYKLNDYLSKRRDVEGVSNWMISSMENIFKNPETTLISVFTQQQLIFNACMSELVRQISVECNERAELVLNIWNQQTQISEKIIEFFNQENSKIEWETLNKIKSLHISYCAELKHSKETYEQNNIAYYENKKKLDAMIMRFRIEKKLNKKISRLCSSLKEEKKYLNGLYCSISKEYIQLLITQGKLKQEQEQFLMDSYNEASEGMLSKHFDFKALRSSIKLKDKTEKQKNEIVDKIVQNKSPVSSDDSFDEEDFISDHYHRRRQKFEEKGIGTDDPDPKINQETETEFNKLFMVSKGIQVQLNSKRIAETQTEVKHTYSMFVQTESKVFQSQSTQTDVTVSKNSEDFEKLKTVYLKKLKVDPITNKPIEQEGSQTQIGTEEQDPNFFTVSEQKRVIGEDTLASNKFQRQPAKKKSTLVSKKSRMSLFGQQPISRFNADSVVSEVEEAIEQEQDTSFERKNENDNQEFLFDSQERLLKVLNKINENVKFVKFDQKSTKCTTLGFQESVKELIKQFTIFSMQVKEKFEENKQKNTEMLIKAADQAMDLEEIRIFDRQKYKKSQLLARNQHKIQVLAEDLFLSSDNDESSPTLTTKNNKSIFGENQRKLNTPSQQKSSSMIIKDPFSNHQNVQKQIDVDKEKDKSKARNLLHLNSQKFGKDESLLQQAAAAQQGNFGEMGQGKQKQNALQRKQTMMTQQLLQAASTPKAPGSSSNIGLQIMGTISDQKFKEKKKIIKKIKEFIQKNSVIPRVNVESDFTQNRQTESIEEAEILNMIDNVSQTAQKKNVSTVESISLKNSVIQTRKLIAQIYFSLSKSIRNGEKLTKKLSFLIYKYFFHSTTSKQAALSKMKQMVDKCSVIPKQYQEISLFNQLIGINANEEDDFSQSEYLNIYLQMLLLMNVESCESSLPINSSQIQTTTSKIHEHLPSILQSYLSDKIVYDIVYNLLKSYIDEDNSSNSKVIENLSSIPIPSKQTIPFQDVIWVVLRKFKENSNFFSKTYTPLYECITCYDDEYITQEQFSFIYKYLGINDLDTHKREFHFYNFNQSSKHQFMSKLNFIGFLNRNMIIDDSKFNHLLEDSEADDLNSRDFDSIEGIEASWKKQRYFIKKQLFEGDLYKPIHRRLIGIIDSYATLIKTNWNNRKHYKTRSFIAYKLLKKDYRHLLSEKFIEECVLPENYLTMNKVFEEVCQRKRLKQAAKQWKAMKKEGQTEKSNKSYDKEEENNQDSQQSQPANSDSDDDSIKREIQ